MIFASFDVCCFLRAFFGVYFLVCFLVIRSQKAAQNLRKSDANHLDHLIVTDSRFTTEFGSKIF